MKNTNFTTLAAAEARVSALISNQLEAKAVAELEACLDAEVFVRSARGPDGIAYKAVPDRAIRLAAAVRIIEFSRGKAPTSIAITSTPPPGNREPAARDLTQAMAQNPELVRTIIDAHIANAKRAIPAG